MPVKICSLIIIISVVSNNILSAQHISADSLQSKVELYNKTQAGSILYVTTDKTLYLPTEVIWFAAYLLADIEKEDSARADILSVILLKENATVALRKNYLIANNYCAGSLTLPDTILPGNYQLIAGTNIVNAKGEPLQVFRTSITIKSIAQPVFTTGFSFLDRPGSDSLYIEARTYLGNGTPAASKKRNTIEYYFLNEKPETAKLNSLGTAIFAVPVSSVRNSNHILYTATTFEGTTKYFNLQLPYRSAGPAIVGFYPEGGNLVTGISSRVAWACNFSDGRPIAIKALLSENGVVIDTLQTDSLGIGLFHLAPRNNSIYRLDLVIQDSSIIPQSYTLPPALPQGVVLEMQDAVVNDTIAITIKSTGNSSVRLAFTSMKNNASSVSPPVKVEIAKRIMLPLDNIHKGLHTLTVLDEQGRPVAERVFFAHFNSKNNVEITTDKPAYGLREKVTAGIQLTNAGGKPVVGVFTIACVAQNRLNANPKENIEGYYYLNHWLNATGYGSLAGNLYRNKPGIEKLLLVKGWRRYTWQHLMQANAANIAALHARKLNLQGQVKYYDGSTKIKEVMNILTRRDSAIEILNTDKKGFFSLKPDRLVIKETEAPVQFKAFSNKKNDGFFIVTITDSMENLLQPLQYLPVLNNNIALKTSSQSSRQQQLEGEPFVKQLETVVVKAKARYHAEGYGYIANECGDYVCRFNFLNCPIHKFESDNRPPVKGETYNFYHYVRETPVKWIYKGCLPTSISFSIYTAREFYGMDSARLAKADEKSYLSTLFWKPFFEYTGTAENNVSFYASDLPGTYKLTVEGVAGNGQLLYGEKIVMIKE